MKQAASLDATFAALADPVRRAIIARLASGSATVTELAAPFAISLPAVSRHLKVLEAAGLIRREVEAQRRRCHLEPGALARAEQWIGQCRTFWQERFDSLDDHLRAQLGDAEKYDE
ncbi:MAG: ArsR family transcriptional regulator [Alphaproteobacteria bacterium]|nr:MAG: ArsR family transcriptional regulator [Alphaproteobacteria bacterium]